MQGMKEREESNIISRIWATGQMEDTEGESGLEGLSGSQVGACKVDMLFRHPSGDAE